MRLGKAVFLATYGQQSLHSKRKAYATLTALLLGSGLLCVVLYRWQSAISLPRWPDSSQFSLGLSVAIQMVVLIAIVSSAALFDSQNDTLAKLLRYLPLTPWRRWWLMYMFQHVFVTLLCAAILPAYSMLAQKLGVSFGIGLVGMALGIVSAFRLAHYKLPALERGLLIFVVGLIELWLAHFCIDPSLNASHKAPYTFGLLVLLLAEIIGIGKTTYKPSVHKQHSLPHAKRIWMLLKIVRSHGGRISFTSSFVFCCLITAIAWRVRLQDTTLLWGAAALLVAATAADIRPLCKKYAPPEIAALHGTQYFSRLLAASAMYSIATAVPIIVYVAPIGSLYEACEGAMLLICASAIGNFAGTVTTSGPRDISGQCLSLCISIGLLIALNHEAITSLPPYMRLGAVACSSALCWALSALVEYKRNSFTWKDQE